jgi:hypothetical protein
VVTKKKQGGIIMGENEVITDLSDIRLLLCDLSDEHKVIGDAVKKLFSCIDSKMDKYRNKEVIINDK